MEVRHTEISDVLIIEPRIFGDQRGFFFESFNERVLAEKAGIRATFVQDNHSRSAHGTVRGLHLQLAPMQGKLVRVIHGEILDVAVDVRRGSPTFGEWESFELDDVHGCSTPRPVVSDRGVAELGWA